jgi:hypothetical protein
MADLRMESLRHISRSTHGGGMLVVYAFRGEKACLVADSPYTSIGEES